MNRNEFGSAKNVHIFAMSVKQKLLAFFKLGFIIIVLSSVLLHGQSSYGPVIILWKAKYRYICGNIKL